MNRLVFFFLASLLVQCSIDRTIHQISGEDKQVLNQFEHLDDKSKLSIAADGESGERLALCLTFLGREDSLPLAQQEVKFYHAAADGEYHLSDLSDESSARLRGSATTDHSGRIFLQTILPADYGSSRDNRHIHTTVFGARPEAYDIHFKQFTSPMGKRFARSSDQHFLADLKHDTVNNLVTFVDIKVKNPRVR